MTIDIAYCDDHASKTVIAAMEGGTMPATQPNHIHDDGEEYSVITLLNQTGTYAPSPTFIASVVEPLIPSPAGDPTVHKTYFYLCEDETRHFFEKALDAAPTVCKNDSGHTISEITAITGAIETTSPDGKVRCMTVDDDDSVISGEVI